MQKPQKEETWTRIWKNDSVLAVHLNIWPGYVEIKASAYEKSPGNLILLIQCFLAAPTLVVGIKDGSNSWLPLWNGMSKFTWRLKLPQMVLERWLIFLVRFIKGFIWRNAFEIFNRHFHVNGLKLVIRERNNLDWKLRLLSQATFSSGEKNTLKRVWGWIGGNGYQSRGWVDGIGKSPPQSSGWAMDFA